LKLIRLQNDSALMAKLRGLLDMYEFSKPACAYGSIGRVVVGALIKRTASKVAGIGFPQTQ
jgi:hypothetical protein